MEEINLIELKKSITQKKLSLEKKIDEFYIKKDNSRKLFNSCINILNRLSSIFKEIITNYKDKLTHFEIDYFVKLNNIIKQTELSNMNDVVNIYRSLNIVELGMIDKFLDIKKIDDIDFSLEEGENIEKVKNTLKKITVTNDNIIVYWNGQITDLENKNIIENIKKIILEFKFDIVKFYKLQQDQNSEFSLDKLIDYNDNCNARINNIYYFLINNAYNNDNLNHFYEKFKSKIFDAVIPYIVKII